MLEKRASSKRLLRNKVPWKQHSLTLVEFKADISKEVRISHRQREKNDYRIFTRD